MVGAPSFRIFWILGVMAFGFMVVLAWGFQRGLQPSDTQRVTVRAGASPFDGRRAMSNLRSIVEIGPRVPGTEGAERTRALIRNELTKSEVPFREHEFEASTPYGKRKMVNIVAEVKGTVDGVILLGNHYDTKYLPDIEFVGANDGGSTTAWMLEMARVLGPKRTGHTIWLAWWDGEEAFKEWTADDSLYGSRAFVEKLEAEGELERLRAVINVDMIGDCYLGIMRDPDAPAWLARAILDEAERLGYGAHFLPVGERIQDDHYPFRAAAVDAINLIDFRYGGSLIDHQRNWHTANDQLDLVCWESLQAVGDTIYNALLRIERHLGGRDD